MRENHQPPPIHGKMSATATPALYFCAAPVSGLCNVLSPPPTPAASLKATESTPASPAVVCGPRMWRESPLNPWPPAPQIPPVQAPFCARPPGQDRAIQPGFSPFQSLLVLMPRTRVSVRFREINREKSVMAPEAAAGSSLAAYGLGPYSYETAAGSCLSSKDVNGQKTWCWIVGLTHDSKKLVGLPRFARDGRSTTVTACSAPSLSARDL